MFINFANFYQYFISGFSKIAALLISPLKTTRLSDKSVLKAFKIDNTKVVDGDSGRANETVMNSFRTLIHMPNIGAIEKSTFLTLDAQKAFN